MMILASDNSVAFSTQHDDDDDDDIWNQVNQQSNGMEWNEIQILSFTIHSSQTYKYCSSTVLQVYRLPFDCELWKKSGKSWVIVHDQWNESIGTSSPADGLLFISLCALPSFRVWYLVCLSQFLSFLLNARTRVRSHTLRIYQMSVLNKKLVLYLLFYYSIIS